MSTKNIKTRILLKHGYETDWDKATAFIPLPGELIIYDADVRANGLERGTNTTPRFKVGDGITKVSALPFASYEATYTTYNELKALRDSSRLVPGMHYRITDYRCTTTQEGTAAEEHRFDIIVQALSKNTLSETASAAYHIENDIPDGYFLVGEEAPVLERLYTILEDENGTNLYEASAAVTDEIVKCSYAENDEGRTVPILYKNDNERYPGEVDYEEAFYYVGTFNLEGELYDRWRKIEPNAGYTWDSDQKQYILTSIVVENNTFLPGAVTGGIIYKPIANLPAWELKYCLDNDSSRFAWANQDVGKGVIYYMKDEYNNECPYDFKNIMFERNINWQEAHSSFVLDSLNLEPGDIEWFYTFSCVNDDLEVEDLSVIQHVLYEEANVYNNVISSMVNDVALEDFDRTRRLCDNIFIGTAAFNTNHRYEFGDNTLGHNCYGNTFGDFCRNNKLENDCIENTFGNFCTGNIFGTYCSNNTFGSSCYNNKLGNLCKENLFGNDCGGNTFGNNCYSNSFGELCINNYFDNDCGLNRFENDCCENTFRSSCDTNTFGSECCRNIFDAVCRNNTLSNSCTNNKLGISCVNNTFGSNCYDNILKSKCSNNTFGAECYANIFEADCDQNTLGVSCSCNYFGADCTNNELGPRCSSNTFKDNCTGNILDETCYANTFGCNCNTNHFEDGCGHIILGDGCMDNTFAPDCHSNIFGDNCFDNIFAAECTCNNIGHSCSGNRFTTGCYNNTFGANCNHNEMFEYSYECDFAAGCSYICLVGPTAAGSITKRVRWVKIGPGVYGSSSVPLQLSVEQNASPVIYEAANTTHIILD